MLFRNAAIISYFLHRSKTDFSFEQFLLLSLTQFLNELLVLIQLLQSLGIHARDVEGVGLVAMLLISQHANVHLGSRNALEPEQVTRTKTIKYHDITDLIKVTN
jgi:hypothetical protein